MKTNHPFIRVHVNGDTNYTDLISKLLGMGLTISIPLDEVSNVEHNAARVAVAERDDRAAVKAKIRQQRAEADAYIAERDEREAKRRWIDDQRARKAHDAQLRRTVAIAASDVECRSCGAKVGAQCVTPQGKPHPAYAHMTRIRDHHTAAGR